MDDEREVVGLLVSELHGGMELQDYGILASIESTNYCGWSFKLTMSDNRVYYSGEYDVFGVFQ